MRWPNWTNRMKNKWQRTILDLKKKSVLYSNTYTFEWVEIADVSTTQVMKREKTREKKSNREVITKQDENHLFKSQYGFEFVFCCCSCCFCAVETANIQSVSHIRCFLILSIILKFWLTWMWYDERCVCCLTQTSSRFWYLFATQAK